MKLDLLAFGSHPDDVELSCAGTLLKEHLNGKKTGIIDLTLGELGTRGDVATRMKEATDAASLLGVAVRENLELADGFFAIDKPSMLAVVRMIRKYRPEIVLCNTLSDRHPDHGRGGRLVADAAFLSGLPKVETTEEGKSQEAWRPSYVFHYVQDRLTQPDFVINVTEVFDKKMESIKAFKSQFYHDEFTGPETYIAKPGFMENVVNRHMLFGKMIGVQYAEGYNTEKKIGIRNFDALICNVT